MEKDSDIPKSRKRPSDSITFRLEDSKNFLSQLPSLSIKDLDLQIKALLAANPDSTLALVPYWKKFAVAAWNQYKTSEGKDSKKIDDIPEELLRSASLMYISQVFALCAMDLEESLEKQGLKGEVY